MKNKSIYARVLLAALCCGAAWSTEAAGAGFDGRWAADVPAKGVCSGSHMTLDVQNNSILGSVVNSEGVYQVRGEIEQAGRGAIGIGRVAGAVHFSANRFTADYPNLRCGLRHAAGTRVFRVE